MKILRKNILGFVMGGIVFGSVGITVASQILATQVSYSNEKSKANVTNVDRALTELYGLAEACQNASGNGIQYKGTGAEVVYLDPTGSATNCSESNYSSTASTGCMRFYVYAEDSEYKYAILDHNTTAKVTDGFYAAQSQVKEDTKEWNPNYQARNIRADEVYRITESTNSTPNWQVKDGNLFYFNATNSTGTAGNGQGYGWLFDRTNSCTDYGCTTTDNTVYGYWTSDARNSSVSWLVDYKGHLRTYAFSYTSRGVRPVIKIAK